MTVTESTKAMILEHAASLSIDYLMDAVSDADLTAADGCWVEADGRCPHGFPSPMLVLGLI